MMSWLNQYTSAEIKEMVEDACVAYSHRQISSFEFRQHLAKLGYNATDIEDKVKEYAPNYDRIIFLDIDGVLNNDHTKEKFMGFTGVDERLAKMFVDWYSTRDYTIILSSSWRIDTAFGDFKAELKRNGILWFDETPQLLSLGRGREIKVKLDQYVPEKYVILDDYGPSEFLKEQRPRLVQTSAHKGLEPKKLAKIDELMGYVDEGYRSPR